MPTDNAARTRRIGSLARLLTLLCLGVVGVSAYMRLLGAGLGCETWPACYGELLTTGTYAPPTLVRLIHRVVATSALLLALYLAWRSLRPQTLRPVAKPVLSLVGLMLVLSVVGIWSADPRLVPVNFINIVGGLGLVSLSWRIVIAAGADGTVGDAAPRDSALAGAMLLLTVTIFLGAYIGASYAATANSGLHWAHRLCAVVCAIVLARLAWRRLRTHPGSPAARVTLALLVLEVALGVATVLGDFPLMIAVAHNVAAAALLAAVARMRRMEAGDAI